MSKFLIYGLSNGIGGVEAIVINMCKVMADTNQFDFLLSDGDCAYKEIFRSLPSLRRINITPWGQSRRRFREDLKHVLLSGNYDYVWFNGCLTSNIDFFEITKKYSKAKTIAHSHGSSFEESNILKRLILLGLHYKNRSSFLELTDIPCMCSIKSGFWFYGKGFMNKNEVYLIKNGIFANRFKYNSSTRLDYRKKLGFKDSSKIIFHVGRLTEVKNQKFIIDILGESVKIDKEVYLVIAGDGPLKDSLIDYAKSMNLLDKIKFLGSRSDVAELYQMADVFILPSFHEGFPVTLVEAQASGLPCIVSNKVTTEVDVSGDITFLDISAQEASEWADIIMNKIRTTRERSDGFSKVCERRYSINDVCDDFLEHLRRI